MHIFRVSMLKSPLLVEYMLNIYIFYERFYFVKGLTSIKRLEPEPHFVHSKRGASTEGRD